MIQAHESLWGNFESRGLEGQEVCLVNLQRFKVDKRDMLLGVRGVQRVEDPINTPESDRPEAQRVDPKSIAGRIRFYL